MSSGYPKWCCVTNYSIHDVLIEILRSSSYEVPKKRVEDNWIEEHFRVVEPVFQIQFPAVMGVSVVEPESIKEFTLALYYIEVTSDLTRCSYE